MSKLVEGIDSSPNVGAFISPEGKIYQAEYQDHYYVAKDICKKIYRKNSHWPDPQGYLASKGWLEITTSGRMAIQPADDNVFYTFEQYDALMGFIEAKEGVAMPNVIKNLKVYGQGVHDNMLEGVERQQEVR